MESKQIDLDFAKAWDASQGDFSKILAENLIQYIKLNKIKVENALDVCCGTSNFLSILNSEGYNCFGTEIDQSMIDYSKEKYPDFLYQKTNNIFDFKFKKKFDLITLNHDMINYLETFKEWSMLFKNVKKHLNKHGLFVFDFYTKNKLKDWDQTTFSSNENLDCLLNIKSGLFDKTVFNFTYYINYNEYMKKTKNLITETSFESNDIKQELKKVGLKNVIFTNEKIEPIENDENIDRIFVIAKIK